MKSIFTLVSALTLLGVLLMGTMCPEQEDDDQANILPQIWPYVCHDHDGDGYGIGGNCLGKDCDVNDPDIYPGAPELCDGVDNQCPDDPGYNIIDDAGCLTSGYALIPAGCFNMGDAFSEGGGNELPVHNVCFSSFYMDRHEVTNAEYAACVSGGGCTAPGNSSSSTRGSYYGNSTYDNFPVIYVSWDQATAYCTWAGKRLPTEAEWEYAARGGLSGKRYPWGDTATACVDANYDGCIGDTSEVESYPANGYGLYDVGGNVWEWVNDWYAATYYSWSPTNDPPGPAVPDSGCGRVLRGDHWGGFWYWLRVSNRNGWYPTGQDDEKGFRCAGD